MHFKADVKPDNVDGLFFGYMERPGLRYVAVRVEYGAHDIVLEHPVLLDPPRHTNNKMFGPKPSCITDQAASTILLDAIVLNPWQEEALRMIQIEAGLSE